MSAGKIRNEDYMRKATLYAMEHVSSMLPRGISPTDIDALLCSRHLIDNRVRKQRIILEYKTVGCNMPAGQRIAFEELMLDSKSASTYMCVVEHPRLDLVNPTIDVTRYKLAAVVGGNIEYSKWICPKQYPLQDEINALFEDGFRQRVEAAIERREWDLTSLWEV